MQIPSVYQAGYAKARALNPDLAAAYVEQTVVGDPEADAVVEALAPFSQREVHRFINAGMERDAELLAEAPPPLQAFFARIETPPAWFDPASVHAGCRAFHAYSDLFIPAFFVVTLQNAASLISKAFYMTGRMTTGQGPRRIRQNTRHFIEIMLPGALDREGEGWKLSVRIRLVHAQVRRLLRAADEWDEAVYGTPISAAHLGLASANFSATMLQQTTRLGASLDAEARTSFMQIWRYASWLIGSPEALLFEGDEAATAELYRVGRVCEPPPGHEASVVVNTLVEALPQIAGISDPAAQRSMIRHVYRDGRETAISMSRHYLFRMIVATLRALRSRGIDIMASMSRGRHWDRISLWLEVLVNACFDPARLPYDQLTLADFGTFWSGMIERSAQVFGHIPPDRLLNVRFEDVLAAPTAQIRRLIRFIGPGLEDAAWLAAASTIPRPTPSKFAQLDPRERAALTAACRPGLERLGYPL